MCCAKVFGMDSAELRWIIKRGGIYSLFLLFLIEVKKKKKENIAYITLKSDDFILILTIS